VNPTIKSLLIFSLVVILAGGVGFLISHTAIFVCMLLAVIAQIVIGWVVSTIRDTQLQKYANQARLDTEAILIANSIAVDCAGCKKPHTIPVIISQRNTFKCRNCDAENVIIVSAETALTTKIDEK